MTKFSKLKIIILFLAAYFLFSLQASAANLNLVSPLSEIGIKQEFRVDLILNTEGQEINAVEAKISFPETLLILKEIRDGNSTINFWIERPKIKKAGIIDFSGIIPGGYQGANGFLFSAVFEAKESGGGAIEIHSAMVLRNDGKGTPANTQISNFQFNINDVLNDVRRPEIKDIDPPELFTPEIVSDPDIFNGKWFLVFATQDKGSGIDHYKVCERIKTMCTVAESPYVLQNQNLNKKIFVKAFDKYGNERIAILPAKFAPWYQKPLVDIVIGLVIITVILLRRWLFKKLKLKTFYF